MKILFFILTTSLLIPISVLAGVDDDFNKNLGNHPCVHSWEYNKTAFKIYLNPLKCKDGDTTATLLTIRYIFESNNAKFPKRIEIYNNLGKKLESYPFENIPSLIIK